MLFHKCLDLIVLGRINFPEKVALILYKAEGLGFVWRLHLLWKPIRIGEYIPILNPDLEARGQELVFLIAPDRSFVYVTRLPVGMMPRANYISGFNQFFQQPWVKVLDVTSGLQKSV